MQKIRIIALALLLAGSLTCGGKQKATRTRTVAKLKPAKLKKKDTAPGLAIRLEPGQAIVDAYDQAALAKGEPLSQAETRALLKRLSPLKEEKSDRLEFALRARSLPPPRTGKTVRTAFPPVQKPERPDTAAAGPLKVLRFSPKGDVKMAPKLSVTFSQPMVEVTSHADSVAKGVPVRFEPKLKGQWRWIGTKTLLFETKVRFPMATVFTAEVPAGTKSKVGGTLAEPVKWTFKTPPPQVIAAYPVDGPHGLRPVFFIGFDQKIDARAVLNKIRVSGGSASADLRAATKDEIKNDEVVSSWVKNAKKDRYVAFVAKEPLSADTSYSITVPKGTPSAEGPLTTEEDQIRTFKTYAPLSIDRTNCTDRWKCRALYPMYTYFNNPLDEESVEAKDIWVQPKLEGMHIAIHHRSLTIYGKTKGRTTYTVTFPDKLGDIYGQRLGRRQTRTFVFQPADPALMSNYRNLSVADPSGDKKFRVHSINIEKIKVQVYAVAPKDWNAYNDYSRKFRWSKDPVTPPGTLKIDKIIPVKHVPDDMVETAIDLKPALDGHGHGQLVVQVSQWPLPTERYKRRYVLAWVQVTDLAVDAFTEYTHLLAWVTRLADGKAVPGAKLSIEPEGGSGRSGAAGLGRLELPARPEGQTKRVLVARTATDAVMLPESGYWWYSSRWYKRPEPGDMVRWYVFDDRKLYKPKEEVRIKGWIRVADAGKGSAIRLTPPGTKSVSYTVYGPRNNKVGAGTAQVGPLGGFTFKFKLPDNVNLGQARVQLATYVPGARGNAHTHYFQIQEFKRPEFEVSSKTSDGPHLLGGHADVAVTASYFAGGGLPGAPVNWTVTTSKAHFTPPNRSEFTFVGWRPFWWRAGRRIETKTHTLEGRTDGQGTHRVRIHFESMDPPRPMSVRAAATVTDVNRRTWTARANLLVHPADVYVGLKTKKYFVRRGTPLKVETVAVDLDGKAVPGRSIQMKAFRQEWRYKKKKYKTIEVDPQTCTVVSAADPVSCTFKTNEGGTYVIRATVHDLKGRPNTTVMTRWVTGGKRPPSRNVEKEKVRLIADKDEYQPGDSAEILVQAPFSPAEGLLTLRREGIIQTQRFSMNETTTTLSVPITEEYFPILHMQVDLVGSAPRIDDKGDEVKGLPRRPAYASGSASLKVPPLKRRLKLEVKPQKASLEPGGSTVIDVTVSDADGKPSAGSGVAVVVVDESVLALTGYKLHDPLGTFYFYRGTGVSDHYLRGHVILMDPAELAKKLKGAPMDAVAQAKAPLAASNAPGGRGGLRRPAPAPMRAKRKAALEEKKSLAKGDMEKEADEPAQPIKVRKDFSPLALFAPALRTDGQGKASVKLKLPDNLTRYRIMAVAVAEAKFYGKGESTVTARNPIMARPSAPRFLNFGDRFEFPVVIQNQTDEPRTVKVAVRGTNLTWTAHQGMKITVPANDRREVRFPASTESAGTARFQVAVASGKFADAAEASLPVWTPATTEAFATYGTIDQGGEVQPVRMPKGVFKQFGGVDVSTSSTAVSALTDAVVYLYSYPFECSEQVASRVLAVAALRDVLTAFKASGLPPPDKVLAAVDRDVTRLYNMQNSDGGWGFWRPDLRSWPFLSCHVTHALVRAKLKGFKVPQNMYSRALNHIKHIEQYFPPWYGPHIRRTIKAYSVYVRALAGDKDVPKAKTIYRELKDLKRISLEGIAWIYPVLSGSAEARTEVTEIRKLINNSVTETAAAAHFRTSYDDGAYLILYSDRRIDGLLLEGLIKDQPKADLIPKIVRGLLAHRKRGRWSNTQENAWVLLALDKYFNTYEKVTPNFIARVWLGDRFAGQHKFRGRTTERHAIHIPMRFLGEPGTLSDLLVDKKGPGRLYFRVGMQYAPTDLRPPAADHGFTLQRRYEHVDDAKDVKRRSDGIWEIRAGARVRVVVTMVAHARRYHVALVDPMPAGLEALNPALRGTEDVPPQKKGFRPHYSPRRYYGRRYMGRRAFYPWWRSTWFEHQNLRDERAEAFTSLLWAGVHTYTYVARAITPGRFVAPPPKAEEMYHPETFGRGPGDIVVVQ